jgi:hypothetical protein
MGTDESVEREAFRVADVWGHEALRLAREVSRQPSILIETKRDEFDLTTPADEHSTEVKRSTPTCSRRRSSLVHVLVGEKEELEAFGPVVADLARRWEPSTARLVPRGSG